MRGGMPLGGLVSPFLSLPLTVPAVAFLSERVLSLDLRKQTHLHHVAQNAEELVIRGTCGRLEHWESHLTIPLDMLSNVILSNRSGFSTDYDVSAVCAEEVSLVIITGDFLTSTDWAGRL